MERARREDDAIRLHRALRLKKIDICPGVPYVYVRSTDVWNGLVYLILSSATRLDAVWRALRPFKEGEKLLQDRLTLYRGSPATGVGAVWRSTRAFKDRQNFP